MRRERFLLLIAIIAAAASSRLLPHPVNVTPIAAIALFSGAQFGRKWLAFAVPLLALLFGDAILGFYPQMWLVYLSFAAIVCMGFLLQGKQHVLNVAAATLSSSVLFFLITNNTLLIHGNLYPAGVDGIMAGYVAGLPFFYHSLLGDLFYSALLFGGFALTVRTSPKLSLMRQG
jgi:hypothetical protein